MIGYTQLHRSEKRQGFVNTKVWYRTALVREKLAVFFRVFDNSRNFPTKSNEIRASQMAVLVMLFI